MNPLLIFKLISNIFYPVTDWLRVKLDKDGTTKASPTVKDSTTIGVLISIVAAATANYFNLPQEDVASNILSIVTGVLGIVGLFRHVATKVKM